MTAGNDFDPAPPQPELFSALLTPHRSLNRTGFLVLMGFVSVVSFAAGLAFLLMGAWPVLGFFGLDVLAIYWAFRVNFRRARASEEISVTPSELRVRRVSHRGHVAEWVLNPLWVRLDQKTHAEFGIEKLYLVSKGRRISIASFLGPDEKASFAKALTEALQAAERGPTYNPDLVGNRVVWTWPPSYIRTMMNLAMNDHMNLAINDRRLTKPGAQNAALRDYDSVRRAIAFISEHWRAQPTIESMADAAGVTPDELHHLFRRWAGLTPKAFMQALTLDHAKGLLRDFASVLDAALDSGLSGPGRLHDLFVTHEAMSPGEWKTGGAGMTLRFGFHPSPFGTAIVIASGRGLAGLAFADPGEEQASLADMQRRWPRATYLEDHAGTAALAQRIFDTKLWRADQPLRVVLIGTDFEVRVWETLLKIPMGRAVCYSDIANNIKSPKASRAVGAAVGKNPVSFVVPCHRALGKGGALTGYHWGITRKQAMLGWEAGQVGVH